MIRDTTSKNIGLPPIHGREIRLLRLLPGDVGSQICCEVTVVDLNSETNPKYVALSYAWGRDSGSEHKIFIDHRPTEVRKNLWRFLHQARRLTSIAFDLIWIDALCIEQEDDSEVTHQVAMMGDIYKSAERAIAWLGPSHSSNGTEQAMRDFQRDVLHWTTSRKATRKWTLPAALAIRSICMRRYWSRLWIFQELLLARETLLVCGASSISMDLFRNFLLAVADWYDNHIFAKVAEQFELRCVRQSPAMAIIKLLSNRRNPSTIYNLMIATQDLQCSKIRDRVYGLLSATRRAQHIVTADYDLPLPELIHNVLREHHRHHQPHAFDDIIEQCRRLAAIMNVKFDDVFHSPRDDLVWKSSMPVEDFEPLSQTIPCDAHAEILPSAVEASDLEQTSNRITATMQNAEAGNDSYVGGVPGNRITFAWAALWKHDVVMGFMLDNTVISLQTAFIQAIKMDHYVVIAALLHANDGGLRRRIDGPIWKEASALQWALHEGRFEIAELLIRAGANVNRRGLDHDHDKKSSEPVPFASTYPLQIAAALGTPEMVKLLMGRGAAIDVRSRLYDWDRMTAIEAAFVYGQGRSAWVLIDRETHRADAVDWNGILRAAIDRRQESGVKLILESAWRQYGQHLDRYSPKITMVQRAVDLGHPGMVTALLENHRCPNTNTGRRGSALQLALGLKDHDAARAIVEVLLLHGADTHAATKGDLEPPLHLAVRRSSEAMTKLLLHHGADVNAQSKARDKETALHAAVAANSSSLAEILVAGGADVEAICDSGAELRYHLGQGPTTPMRLAVGHVEPGMIRLLLQSGAKAEPSLLSLLSSSAGRYRDVNQAQIDEALRLLLEYGANAGKEISMEDFSREALGAPGTPKYYERYPRAIRET